MSDALPTDSSQAPTLPRVIRALLEPASSVGAATQRRKARLLATFLCILFVVFGVVDVVGVLFVPGHVPPWYGYVCLTVAWLLNRADRYTSAAALTLAMFPAVILGMVLGGYTERPAMILCYLALGVQLAGILLAARGTALFAGLVALVMLATPWLAPQALPHAYALLDPLAMVAVSAGLSIVAILHRDRLERDRQAERDSLIRELESKNAELERFSYTVSHDLKTPLITIRGFLGILAKDLAEGRTDRWRADLARVTGAADRMERLLSELLRLSRVGRVANPAERVPFARVVEDAVALQRPQLQQRGIELVVDAALPSVYGDRLRIVEVVQNLLENAAKFMGDQPKPRIRIGARFGDEPVLLVQDNGIGIEPRHQDKIFGLFQKLDPEAEGTGVGLALVKRIVEVHGGRVWVESAGRGQGTTVCFTLPQPVQA
jgi:signal transduction histidine kinase